MFVLCLKSKPPHQKTVFFHRLPAAGMMAVAIFCKFLLRFEKKSSFLLSI